MLNFLNILRAKNFLINLFYTSIEERRNCLNFKKYEGPYPLLEERSFLIVAQQMVHKQQNYVF